MGWPVQDCEMRIDNGRWMEACVLFFFFFSAGECSSCAGLNLNRLLILCSIFFFLSYYSILGGCSLLI